MTRDRHPGRRRAAAADDRRERGRARRTACTSSASRARPTPASPASRTPGSTGARSAAWWRRCAARAARELVIAGGVRRPDLWRIRPDAGFFTSLPQIVRLLAGGDDSVLSRVVRFFEGKGFDRARRARGGARPAGGRGPHGRASTFRAQDRADAELGFAVRQALGRRRCRPGRGGGAAARCWRSRARKAPTPCCERVARPARPRGSRGPAGRAGQGAEARPGAARRHAGHRAAHGRAGGGRRAGRASWSRPARCWCSTGPRPSASPTRAGCAIQGLPAGRAAAGAGVPPAPSTGRVIGRCGRAAASRATSRRGSPPCRAPGARSPRARRVVVVRHYILAIEAAEGPPAMLERAAALRQWGLRWRKVGRAGPPRRRTRARRRALLEALLAQAAAQELRRRRRDRHRPTRSARTRMPRGSRTSLGLFLVLCEAA